MTTGKRIVFSVLAGFMPMLMWAHKNGPDPRHTAAPGDDQMACATATCHTNKPSGGPLNAFGGSVSATFSSSTYTPGQPVTITVSVSDPNPPESMWHGFQMTARLENDLVNGQAGTFQFTNTSGTFVLCDDKSVSGFVRRGNTACPANAPVEFIEHNTPSTGTWTFTWLPPTNSTQPVHFYIAGNAVVLDDTPDEKDHVYTASYVLQPFVAGPPPSISSIRQAEGWGDGTSISSGTWFQIKGANLSSTTDTWDSIFPSGNNVAPTSLDGVSVTVAGKPAFVYFVSSGQINAQVPDVSDLGSVSVTVTNPNGSATSQVTKVAVSPGLLAPPSTFPFSFFVNGKQYLDATIGVANLYVGNTNFVSNFPYPFRPAAPGDTVIIYGIGFGDVTPPLPAGMRAGSDKLNAPLTISFDQTQAAIAYAGHYPSYVGLYFFAVTVPDITDGDHQIIFTLNGQKLSQTAYLTVHR